MEYLIAGIVLLAVLVLLGIGLVTSRQRRRLTSEAAIETARARARPGRRRGADRAPDALQVPEAPATRLARLRARLARSGSTLGSGLLTLLSRENLDQATWDEVEETLLLSDLGVTPTAQLVERLRTRVRVDGVKDPTAVRALLREELPRARRPDPRPIPAPDLGGRPGGCARRRRQRDRQDDDHRQAVAAARGRGPDGPPRSSRHVPRGGIGAAADLGRSGRRRSRPR